MNETTTDEESSCTPRGEFISLDEKAGGSLSVLMKKCHLVKNWQ